jgi:protein-S-isoprenylcysteine O-methyltransferase Ste14
MFYYLSAFFIILFSLLRWLEVKVRTGKQKGEITHLLTFKLLAYATSALALTSLFYSLKSPPLYLTALGVLFMLSAFYLRHQAATALGAFWSVHIEIRKDHPVIQTGPYKYVRHPIYTSILLEGTGFVLLSGCIYTLPILLFGTLPCLLYRLKLEEREMVKAIEPSYTAYMEKTGALLPKL